MARTVRRETSKAYLRQAEEFLVSATSNLEGKRYNAAGFDAIQCLIHANDALTAWFLGSVASLDHREAVQLHVDVVRVLGDASQRETLKRSLDERSSFGYLGVSASRAQSERVLRDAARFLAWVRRCLEVNDRSPR
jgi:HEPN domain-containing protein